MSRMRPLCRSRDRLARAWRVAYVMARWPGVSENPSSRRRSPTRHPAAGFAPGCLDGASNGITRYPRAGADARSCRCTRSATARSTRRTPTSNSHVSPLPVRTSPSERSSKRSCAGSQASHRTFMRRRGSGDRRTQSHRDGSTRLAGQSTAPRILRVFSCKKSGVARGNSAPIISTPEG